MDSALFKLKNDVWISLTDNQAKENFSLVLCFGSIDQLQNERLEMLIHKQFAEATIVYCSTAGEIAGKEVLNNALIAVALRFDRTEIITHTISISQFADSRAAGASLMNQLMREDLCYAMIFSDGNLVNGSQLVKGLNDINKGQVPVTGGLAGDNGNFKSTLVGLNRAPCEGEIVAIGFYGNSLLVTHGSQGGWDVFGLEKLITGARNNVLYEIDQKNALSTYKRYLGPDSTNLPASALLFPLSVTEAGSDSPVVRTILSVDEVNETMTFAGDVPEGARVRFMKANFDRIIAAASTAAFHSLMGKIQKPDFALLVSCVGRKIILDSRVDEEVEAVCEIFGDATNVAGFYSYGEIAPFNSGGECQLHNQTMTVTCFYELP